MDPYTEQLIERTRHRREMLNQKLGKTPEAAPRKRRTPLSEDLSSNIGTHKDNINDDDSPKRQCTREYEQQVKPDTPAISSVKSRLHTLASERTCWSDTSDCENVAKPAEAVVETYVQDDEPKTPKSRFGRLAALAQNINTWEDDLSHPTLATKKDESTGNNSPVKSSKSHAPPAPPCPTKDESKCFQNSPKKFHAPQPPVNNNNSSSSNCPKTLPSSSQNYASPIKSQLSIGSLHASAQSSPAAKIAKPLHYVASVKGSPTKDGRRVTEQIPVNSKGLNESPTTDEQTDDEPTKQPVADRFAKWAKKTESFKSDTAPKTPLSSRVASWEQKVSQTPKNQTSSVKTPLTPRHMCTPVVSSASEKPSHQASSTPAATSTRKEVSNTPAQNTATSTSSVDPASLSVSARMAQWQQKTAGPRVEEEPTAYSVIARMSAWEHMSSNNQVSHIKKVDPSSVNLSPNKQTPPRPQPPHLPKTPTPSKTVAPAKGVTPTKSLKDDISERIQLMKSGQSPVPKSPRVPQSPTKPASPAKTALSPSHVSNSMKSVHQRLMEQTHNSSKSKEIENKIRQERMAELQCIQNRWKNGILKEESSTGTTETLPETVGAKSASLEHSEKNSPNKKDIIRAKAREDFDRKLAAMGFDVSDDGASFNFKKGGQSFNQHQAETNNPPPPPPPPPMSSSTQQKSEAPTVSRSLSSQNAKPPIPPASGCLKSRSNSIYRIISKKEESSQQNTRPEGQTDGRQPVTERRVQFEDSFESTDDNDTSDAAASSRGDSTDLQSRDEFQDSFDDRDTEESESDYPRRPTTSAAPRPALYDEGDDVSLSAFVPASVRRESIIPTGPVTERNRVSDASLDSFDEPLRRQQPSHYSAANTGQAGQRVEDRSSTESEGCYSVRIQHKFKYVKQAQDDDEDNDRSDINNLLDEAMDEEEDSDSSEHPVPAPRHQVRSESSHTSNSPLIYSISMYRSKKYDRPNPKLSIVRNSAYANMHVEEENIQMPTAPLEQEEKKSLHERIQELQELVKQEQSVICQTSNALKQCCASNSYFAGSAEQVECNRLLLIATQKRQSYLVEISRLKETRNLDPAGPGPKGSLTISDIRLPLKKEFVTKIGTGHDNMVYYFILLIKNNAQVICTQMLSTHDPMMRGSLDFPNLIKLNGVTAGFKITIDIYGMSVSRENPGKEKKKKTPKKQKGYGMSVQSPGGPNAVRTTSFSLITSVPLDMKSLDKTCFNLERLPYLSPLHGTIYMRLKCLMEANVEERGFLTMFEDVSGLGAWHRRWVVLAKNKLCFWKYPDDETRKDPMGIIDLKRCITEKVGLIPRDICARPNTFEVVTVRQPRRGEQDTLISKTYNTMTTMKHLLSADTKEERIVWCNMINRTLANIRLWHSDAMRPIKLSDK